MLEIWGRRNSSNVMSVTWTVGELGLDFQRHDVGGTFGETGGDEYRKMNPNGLVPTIRDQDLVMWESNAIVRYLSQQYGTDTLYPTSIAARAKADQWMDWFKSSFYPALMPAFLNMIRTPAIERNQQAIDESVIKAGKILSMLDHHLKDKAFVAGDILTMGDIPMGPAMYRYYTLDIDRPSHCNVEAWYQRLTERPAFQHHVMIPFGKNLDEWIRLEKEGAGTQ